MPFEKMIFSKIFPITPLTRGGTGKTYASAFAMRELGFKRVLFLVHRNQIAKQAKTSFERVFGSRIRTGLVSGTKYDYEADFVFATVQTLSRQENLERFPKDYFDACIYDEYEIIGLSQEAA